MTNDSLKIMDAGHHLYSDLIRCKFSMLVEAALRASSSKDLQPWEFIVVTDRDSLDKLSRAKPHGSAYLSNAPLGIVL